MEKNLPRFPAFPRPLSEINRDKEAYAAAQVGLDIWGYFAANPPQIPIEQIGFHLDASVLGMGPKPELICDKDDPDTATIESAHARARWFIEFEARRRAAWAAQWADVMKEEYLKRFPVK